MVVLGKKQKSAEGGANWMDTYGDMVTLLLCFFVLLYSMSTVDTNKWEMIVKSFNPNAEDVTQIVTNTEKNDGPDSIDGSMEKPEAITNFDDLYYTLVEYVQNNNLDADVEVSKGDGFTFITFRNDVFFDGNSYVLKDQGKLVLDDLSKVIYQVRDSIEEIQVLGHTSQAQPNQVNEISSDRFLSSNRATVVLVYLQEKNILNPAKLVSTGYGQFRPISTFDTAENRAKNRRVELLITKTDSIERSLDDYYKEVIPSEQIDSARKQLQIESNLQQP